MRSLQTKLFSALTLLIALFLLAGIALFALNRYAITQYKSVSNNMIAEYYLTDAASRLIAAYNVRFLSTGSIDEGSTDKKIDSIKNEISGYIAYLNTHITDPQSVSDYVGLKNSIYDVQNEINAGLATLKSNDVSNAGSHYTAANQKIVFVTQNSSTLLFDELKRATTDQAQIDKTYNETSKIVIAMLAIIVILTTLYAYRFAKRLIIPLRKLSGVAGSIATGNLDAAIDPSLIRIRDEVGSLAASFSSMLLKLRGTIEELNKQKTSVERQVQERTAELSAEQARLSASVNSLSLGFILTDANSNILMMNSMARSILSYKVDEQGVSVPDPSYAAHDWSVDEINERLKEHFEFKDALTKEMREKRPLERKEVEYNGRILRFFLAPVLNDRKEEPSELGSVILLEDITEEKVIERSKDEFFSIASHELRTPLTAIRGNAGMIEQFYGDQVKDQDFHSMLGDIHESSVRLIEIVNDFLDASRLEQGKIGFKLEPFSIDSVIESVVYETAAVAKEKKNVIELNKTLDSTPPVYADKDRVKQIVYNFIGNAMKFTENGKITISAEVTADKMLKIIIEDTGAGISEQSQKLLFHKFQQAGDSLFTRDTSKGTGLGLYISKLLTEKMGGRIALESSHPGKGTTFSFTLPIDDGSHSKPQPEPEAEASPAPDVQLHA